MADRPIASEHKFPHFDCDLPCLSVRWNDGKMIAEENGREIPLVRIPASICAELLSVVAERDEARAELAQEKATSAHWKAEAEKLREGNERLQKLLTPRRVKSTPPQLTPEEIEYLRQEARDMGLLPEDEAKG